MRKSGVDAAKKATSDGKFPIGMRVMAVDDDLVCLKLLETQLIECGYEVTATQHPHTALKLLKENSDDYDLLISDVRMPEIDGFRLLEMIGPEIRIPVIMLSVDSEVTTVMKGIKRGACDYLVKPVRLQDLKIIWKHVAMKSINDTKEANDQSHAVAPLARVEDDCSQKPTRKHRDRGKEKEDEGSNCSDDDNSMQKKPRVSWSQELHAQFIRAVNQLGVDRAVPKKILDLMNVPGLSRENVASHLQKYRNAIKRSNIGVHPQGNGGLGSHGFGATPPRSVFVSYSGRGMDSTRSSEVFSAGGFQYHQPATLFGHGSASQIASAGYPLPTNHPQLSQQHHASTSQDDQLTTSQFAYGSNALAMNFTRNQSEFNQLTYQSLTPRPTHVNGYLEYSSQDPWVNTVEPLQSVAPETLNEDPIQFLADTSSSLCADPQGSFSEALEALLPNKQLEEEEQKLCTSADPQELGIKIDEEDALNMQNDNKEHLEGTYHLELADQLGEHSTTESMFHFNKCESADDLHAVLRQFQQ